MEQFNLYKNKVIFKILLSKIVYNKKSEIFEVKKCIFSALPNVYVPEVAAVIMAGTFVRKPCFYSIKNRRTKTYKLDRITLTSRKKNFFRDVNAITNTVLPAQIENSIYNIKLSKNNSANWTMKTCRPPTQLYMFLYKYPIIDDTYKMNIHIQGNRYSLFETIYYLRLFQLPVDLI